MSLSRTLFVSPTLNLSRKDWTYKVVPSFNIHDSNFPVRLIPILHLTQLFAEHPNPIDHLPIGPPAPDPAQLNVAPRALAIATQPPQRPAPQIVEYTGR